MMKLFFGALLLLSAFALGQDRPVKIETEEIPNRLAFYAVNENEKDLDVLFELKGTNFRQSAAKPRFIRVPATSRVHMKTVVLLRGKKPSYTYTLVVNDSLSNRSLIKEYQEIKIRPGKSITVYVPENCLSCDSLIIPLRNGPYLFTSQLLGERQEIKDQLAKSFGNRINLDSLRTPVVNLGGKLYTSLSSYDELLELLHQE